MKITSTKNVITFICPLVCGLFGGLFAQSVICILSIMVSPFSEIEEASFLLFCFFTMILSAVFILVTLIFNIVHLINIYDNRKTAVVIATEILICSFIFFLSWNLWLTIFQELHKLFWFLIHGQAYSTPDDKFRRADFLFGY